MGASPAKPRRNPGAMLFGKFPRFTKTAAWRHGEHRFARDGNDTQGIAPRLAMTPQADEMNRAIADDLDGLRFGRTAIEECAQRHGRQFRGSSSNGFLSPIVTYSSNPQGTFFLPS